LNGYVPAGLTLAAAAQLRKSSPQELHPTAHSSMATHCAVIGDVWKRWRHVFDYGKNLREGARLGRLAREVAFSFPRPSSPHTSGPCSAKAAGPSVDELQNKPDEIRRTERLVASCSQESHSTNWSSCRKHLPWEGLAARVCWLGMGSATSSPRDERPRAQGEIGPIAVTATTSTAASVAQPLRRRKE